MTQDKGKMQYSAENIQILEGLEAVRKRPAMYIGDVGQRGLHHLIYEVVDNSIDEAMAGYCNRIRVTLHQDGSVTVSDNGRGIPVDMHPKEKRSALEVVMTVLHAGGKFDKNSYKVSGGLHGVGVSVVNALSEWLKAVVYREGKTYQQEYRRGKPLYPVREVGTTRKRGTTVTFKPDAEIFHTTEFKFDTVAARLRELAFLNKGVTLELVDEREKDDKGKPRKEVFHSEGGLKEFVRYIDINRTPIIPEPIYMEGEQNGIPIQIAFEYTDGTQEHIHSYVNNINTIEGGTHVTGFRRALTRTMKSYFDRQGLTKGVKIELTGEDFREGLTAVVSVKVMEPLFEGQTKTKLGNTEVSGAVESLTSEKLSYYLEEHPREARVLFEKVLRAAEGRVAAKKAREMVQRKSAFQSGSLPGKLADCSSRDPHECEIYIVEGESAGGTAKQGRDRRFQAILPLKGKILNVEKAKTHKIFANEEIQNLFTALGVHISPNTDELNLEKLRYHKIIIMTDADVDGSHIRTLLLTFFFRRMPELIEQGHVYIAIPPLYLIRHGKKETYAYSDEERDRILERLKSEGVDPKKINVQRYKGLGEMNAEQLWTTTMDPERRILKRVSIENAAEADRVFSMLMGSDVPARREFIEQHATYANLDV